MMKRMWVAATAAAVAAICLIVRVLGCKFSRSKKNKRYPDDSHPNREPLLGDKAADGVQRRGDCKQPERASRDSQVHGGQLDYDGPRTTAPTVIAQRAANTSVAPQHGANGAPAEGGEGSGEACLEAVDLGFLQGLLDDQLGPPKFSVPKAKDAPVTEHSSSLQDLLDREFGPPKFAVQKSQAAGGPAQPGDHDHAPGMQPSSSGRRLAGDRPALHLAVTEGPAAGTSLRPSEDQAEITIGRLPASTLPIVDQEVSGRHAVIHFDERQDCWKVMDAGSLNGSILNGVLISNSDRRPGQQHMLGDQDVLELGGVTKIKVFCSPQATGNPAKRHAAANTWTPSGSASPSARSALHTTAKLPAPVHIGEYPSLGLRMVVHQRVGTDHLRTNTGIEDVVHHQCPFEPFGEQAGLLCVFDGHNGSQAANRAKALVPGVLTEKLGPGGGDGGGGGGVLIRGRPQEQQQQLLKEVFLEADTRIASDEGCTATVVLLDQDAEGCLSVQSANVGDSSAVVVNLGSCSWCKLTADHRIANSSSERQRLQARGHTVKKRLYGLNISRMLGDKFLKDEDLGFIAEPHVSHVEQVAGGQRALILLASDGLWDVLSEERAAGLVLKAHAEDPSGVTAEAVADMLLSQALTLRSQDDISIMVVDRAG